jgi:hypothetical protein
MKRIVLPIVLMLAGSQATGRASTPAASPAAKANDATVEFVSADSDKKTVTIKIDGQSKTFPVEDKADLVVYQTTKITKGLIKAGDKIKVTYRDNPKGEHQAVTAIVKVDK